MKYFFALGNTPKLSVLEIKSIIPDSTILHETDYILIFETKKELDTTRLINTLGGTIKIGVIVEDKDWKNSIVKREEQQKIKFGFSFYALSEHISDNKLIKLKQQFKKEGLNYKKELRSTGQRAELIESHELALSSVIISKEKCLDILVLVDENNKIIYGQTLAVQLFREFSHRDYDRPNKDSHSGMLPPKVARMMVNLAQGDKQKILLDPFCGSGTVLQEALLLGYKKVIGSDISAKAITDTKKNLEFLKLDNCQLIQEDVLNLEKQIKPNSIATIVTEVYLGPVNFYPSALPKIISDLIALYEKAFVVLKKICQENATLVIAFPAWRDKDEIMHLPIKPKLEKLGFKIKTEPLIYGRPDARVLREIYVMGIHRPPA